MLNAFETMARNNPLGVCFAEVDPQGRDVPYGYQQIRIMSSAIAWHLAERGAKRNTYVLVDLPNHAVIPLLVMAAAYGGFGLVFIDYRMPAAEREAHKRAVAQDLGADLAFCVDKTNMMALMRLAVDILSGKREMRVQEEGSLGANLTQRTLGGKAPALRGNSFRFSGGNQRNSEPDRKVQSNNAQVACAHFADRQRHLFNPDAPAFIFPTTDAHGFFRAVCYTWRSILGNAAAANEALGVGWTSVWQCVLPLCTVEGMQTLLWGLVASRPFVLYRRFIPEMVLRDVRRYNATHIMLTPKRLEALIATGSAALGQYACVVVDCSTPTRRIDANILAAGRRATSHVRLCYGLPETAGMVAVEDDATREGDGAGFTRPMRPLSGCDVQISSPDAQGFGLLNVRSPGLFSGYLDGTPARTRNGFLLTGNEAALYRGCLYVR